MSEIRSPREPDPVAGEEPRPSVPTALTGDDAVELVRLPPLLPRRQNPWLIVEVDGTPAGHGALVWALREAARRDATVVAVHVLEDRGGDPLAGSTRARLLAQLAASDRLEARVLRAIA